MHTLHADDDDLRQALDDIIPGGTGLSRLEFMAFMILPTLLICYIPSLKYLAPLSMVAALMQSIGLVFTFYYMVHILPVVTEPVPAFAGWSKLPLFFGSAIYAFEGVGLVIPLENNMGTPAAVKILIGGSVFLSYPLQFYVVEIMKPAALIPNIGLFISLIGAVASSTLAIIFPCIMEIVTFWPNMGKYNLTLVKCILITV